MLKRLAMVVLLATVVLIAIAMVSPETGVEMSISDEYRPAAEVRRTGNRLREEGSLYLQQHAQNPVDWYPWGDAALTRARAEDKPIFLSSGYSSCHWCHVMEHEVFEHDDVAEVLNRHFICIKLDREERPDVDATYMKAVQLMTGSGGWPMSVFMTPDLEPFFGATYIPKDRFLGLLDQITSLWTERRSDLENQADSIAQRMRAEPVQSEPKPVDDALLAEAVAAAAERFDDTHGGFVGAMKFPVPVRWSFLLHWYRKTGDPEARRMVETTLESMARGGLRDHVGGGFHRYTTDAHWTVPHFEKMLYDNAQLASLFLEAGAALDRPDFTDVGVDVLEFLDREMVGDEGACYASFDADSGGEEGTYYVWTPDQVAAVVGEADGAALAAVMGVTAGGNFEHGTSVATQRTDDDSGLFARHRLALREARTARVAPTLDRKIVTSWNGLALRAFARGAMVTGRDDFQSRAELIVDYLRRVHRGDDGTLSRASNEGRITGEAVLDDHALLARGLLDLYQLTGNADHLAWAGELLATVDARFAREGGGGWYTESDRAQAPLGRRQDLFDSVIPGGTSAMLDARLVHGALIGAVEAEEMVGRALSGQADLVRRAGLEMAGWLDAALWLSGPVHEVVVAGDRGSTSFTALWRATVASLSPGVVATPVPADGPSARLLALAPALVGKTALGGLPTAYVCRLGVCQAPQTDLAAVVDAVGEGWVR